MLPRSIHLDLPFVRDLSKGHTRTCLGGQSPQGVATLTPLLAHPVWIFLN